MSHNFIAFIASGPCLVAVSLTFSVVCFCTWFLCRHVHGPPSRKMGNQILIIPASFNTVLSNQKNHAQSFLAKAWFPYNRNGTCTCGSACGTTWNMSQADFFNGNTCPRYRRQSACGTGRAELSSTFQAIPVPQADENFNGNTHRRYRRYRR